MIYLRETQNCRSESKSRDWRGFEERSKETDKQALEKLGALIPQHEIEASGIERQRIELAEEAGGAPEVARAAFSNFPGI